MSYLRSPVLVEFREPQSKPDSDGTKDLKDLIRMLNVFEEEVECQIVYRLRLLEERSDDRVPLEYTRLLRRPRL